MNKKASNGDGLTLESLTRAECTWAFGAVLASFALAAPAIAVILANWMLIAPKIGSFFSSLAWNVPTINTLLTYILIGFNFVLLALPAIYAILRLVEAAHTFRALDRPIQYSSFGDIPGTVVLFNARDYREFREIWNGAVDVRAYNPPLDRLKRIEFRRVINALLDTKDFEYRIIVGKESAERLEGCYEIWEDDGQKRVESLNGMKVKCLSHTADLHTRVSPWSLDGGRGTVHGLSIFLIKKDDGGCEVILYPLGQPFVEDFKVPIQGIRVTTQSADGLYAEFRKRFDGLWENREAFTESGKDGDGLTLPDFIVALRNKKTAEMKADQNVCAPRSPLTASIIGEQGTGETEDVSPPECRNCKNKQNLPDTPSGDDEQKPSGESPDNKE